MIQHIFFDLDNTLWDHRENAKLTLKELFIREKIEEKYSLSFSRFYERYYAINEDLWDKIRDGKIDKVYLRKHRFYDCFLSFEIDDFDLSQRFEHHFLDEILQFNQLVEGTHEILEYLYHKKYILHILSNGFSEVTLRKCELSGISKYFTTITSADEINVRKPHKEIFEFAFKKAKAQKEYSIIIGDDWIADFEGGISFGIDAIYFDVFNEKREVENIKRIERLDQIRNYL